MRLTDTERLELAQPEVARGARLEAEYRRRCEREHTSLVHYVRALAEHSPVTSREIAVSSAQVWLAGASLSDRLRAAVRVLDLPVPLRWRGRLRLR